MSLRDRTTRGAGGTGSVKKEERREVEGLVGGTEEEEEREYGSESGSEED